MTLTVSRRGDLVQHGVLPCLAADQVADWSAAVTASTFHMFVVAPAPPSVRRKSWWHRTQTEIIENCHERACVDVPVSSTMATFIQM